MESELELMKPVFENWNWNWNLNVPQESELAFNSESNEFRFGTRYLVATFGQQPKSNPTRQQLDDENKRGIYLTTKHCIVL